MSFFPQKLWLYLYLLVFLVIIIHGFEVENFRAIPRVQKTLIQDKIRGVSTSTHALLFVSLSGLGVAKAKDNLEYMPALKGLDYGKPRTLYPDFTQMPSGLQYKIVKPGGK